MSSKGWVNIEIFLLKDNRFGHGCFRGRWDSGRGFFGLDLVELGIEDVLDPLVGENAGRQGTTTGGVQAVLAVPFGQAQDAHTGTIGLLRMFAGGQERLHELGSVRPDSLSPAHEPVGRPLLILLMGRGHVFSNRGVPAGGVRTAVGSDPAMLEKDFDGGFGGANVDLFVDQGMGDAVVVLLELDVVVDVDTRLLPDGEFVGQLREGLEGGLVQHLEELAAGATEVFHEPRVELIEQFADSLIQVCQAKEGAVAQTGKDPALDYLDAHFCLGFVFGLANARRDDGCAIVLGQVLVGGIQVWLIPARVFHPRLEIIWDHDLGNTAKESEHADVGTGPVGQVLAPVSLGIGIVAGAQYADEDLGLANLARLRVDDGHRLTGVVYKDLFPTFVRESHRWIQPLGPLAIESAELTVAIPVRVGFAIFDPQQPQRDALLAQLCVNQGPIGTRDDSRTWTRRLGEEEFKELILIQVDGEWPVQPRLLGSSHVLTNCTVGDRAAAGDRPVRQAALPFQAKNFTYFAHG